MTPTVTAFSWVPAFAQGYVRDLRVRWACEEAGLSYEAELIGPEVTTSAAYRRRQPFGQVPAYRDDNVEMFESGAIVLYLADKSEVLAPADARGRARVTSWIVAALNSVEPHVQNYVHLDTFHSGKSWVEARRPELLEMLEGRLTALAGWLADADYLEGRFTAADLILCTVLREAVDCGVLAKYPTLDAHRQRCEARPAFARAMADQLRPFSESAPAQ